MLDLSDRYNIFLTGEITQDTCKKFTEDLLKANGQLINLIINSPGGDFGSSMYIANLVERNHKIRTIAIGDTSSGAFMIFIAADERISTPYAYYMSHVVAEFEGEEEIRKPVDTSLAWAKNLLLQQYRFYRRHIDMSGSEIKKIFLTDHESEFSPLEMKKFGLVTKIDEILWTS